MQDVAKMIRWLALLLGAWCAACGSKSSDAAPKQREAVPVVVATATQQDVPREVSAFGSVEASSTVDVVAQVSGLVTEVHFKEGDLVKKGDLLFTVDTRPYRASLAAAQAELSRNQALAAQASTEAERAERLQAEGLASQQELARARAEAASSEANVQVGQAQIQSARLNVTFTRITSPMDGRTGSLLVHAGNVVRPSDTQPLVVIRSLSPVHVRFSVPQDYLATIREQLGREPPIVRARGRGEGAKTVEGPLTFMENTVDPATGTLALKASFSNEGLELWPGAAVDVSLVLGVDRQALVVPAVAVQRSQSGTYCYLVDANKRAVLRPVEVARSSATLSLIRSGLSPGDRVVTDGQVRLRDGARVSVQPADKPTAAAPSAERSAGPP